MFSLDDLMTTLVSKAGLPEHARTDDPSRTLADVGLDSLAFLQLQADLQARYGVELPDGRPTATPFGEMVAFVNDRVGVA